MNRKFSRNEKDKFSNEEKLALGELVKKYKEEYDAEVKRNERKTRSNRKRKKHVPIKPNTGYVANAIYFNLAQTHNDDSTFVRAVKLTSRSYNDLLTSEILLHVHQRRLEQMGEGKRQRHQDQMLKTISNLSNRFSLFTPNYFAIYILDNYAVHLIPRIRWTRLCARLCPRICARFNGRRHNQIYTGKRHRSSSSPQRSLKIRGNGINVKEIGNRKKQSGITKS